MTVNGWILLCDATTKFLLRITSLRCIPKFHSKIYFFCSLYINRTMRDKQNFAIVQLAASKTVKEFIKVLRLLCSCITMMDPQYHNICRSASTYFKVCRAAEHSSLNKITASMLKFRLNTRSECMQVAFTLNRVREKISTLYILINKYFFSILSMAIQLTINNYG